MTPEGRVKADIKKFLNSLPNCFWWMPPVNGYGTNGIPDFVGCYLGVFFAIEAKRPGGLSGVTALQQDKINRINQAHGYAIAADNVEAVKAMFEQIDAGLHFVPPARLSA